MEVRRYIEVSERLRRLVEEAETEAKTIVADAEARAEKILSDAREEARTMRLKAETGEVVDQLVKEAQDSAHAEALKITGEYDKRVSRLLAIDSQLFNRAVDEFFRRILES